MFARFTERIGVDVIVSNKLIGSIDHLKQAYDTVVCPE